MVTYFLPSFPEGLEKNWTRKVLFGMLLSLPRTAVEVAEVLAEERTDLFCRPLGPGSGSPGSLAVGPLAPGLLPAQRWRIWSWRARGCPWHYHQ